MTKNPLIAFTAIATALLGLLSNPGHAQTAPAAPPAKTAQMAAVVDISGAWVRTAVPGQMGTGGFMKLVSKDGGQLIGVSSPVAGVAEVHEMAMEGGVMKMRAIPFLALPAGQTVELKPGGYHIMLMDLKQALPVGFEVPVVLTFKDPSGKTTQQSLKLPVSSRSPTAGSAPAMEHKH